MKNKINEEEISKFFAEIVTRRKAVNIPRTEAQLDLSKSFGLVGLMNVRGVGSAIADLESIEHLERVLAKPQYHTFTTTERPGEKPTGVEGYVHRMSCYLNYLGFGKESTRLFSILSRLDINLVYHPNSIEPSAKVKAWLKSNKRKL